MNKTYLIGNAHIDPVWLWQWYEGYAEVKATFRSALDRMKDYPDFKFTSACAAYYEWVKESDPEMFDEIRERVKEGRWCITGGWYIQPDCNIPSGESFARHALISQRFFEKELGTKAKVGYNVDSFGHNGSIPMLLKNAGMDSYVFMRPGPHEKDIPDDLFRWQSADGSTVTVYRIPFCYCITQGDFGDFDRVSDMAKNHAMMAFYGVGNHGGGPTMKLLEKMEAELDMSKFVHSTPNEFFDDVRDNDMPLLHGDLQFHAKGCYSANAKIKADNRKCEAMLLAAEKYSVLAGKLTNAAYPTDAFTRGWKNVIFNQFHDIMGGCSIKDAYSNAAMLHGEAMSIADRQSNFAMQKISWAIDTIGEGNAVPDKNSCAAGWTAEGAGTPFVIFNPHAWSVRRFISVHSSPRRLYDLEGNPVKTQTIRAPRTNGRDDKWETGFFADVPAFGYTVYRGYYEGEPNKFDGDVAYGDTFIENSAVRLDFNPATGELCGFIDKRTGRKVIDGETKTVLIDETDSDTWAHNIRSFRKVAETFSKGECHILEAGNLRAVMRTFVYGENSTVRRDYIITSDSDTVEVRTQVNFNEKHRMLKFVLPVCGEGAKVHCGIPFGSLEKPNDGDEQVGQAWVTMNTADGGLTAISDSKYSFSAMGNDLELTALRGAIFADHFGARDEFCEYQEQGRSEFTYELMPACSDSECAKRAAEFDVPPFAIVETFHKGPLGSEFSGISADKDNIIVTAVKKHEDSDAVVIRAYEAEGRDTEAELTVFGKTFKALFTHNTVKTFIVDGDSVSETNFLE